MSTSTQHHTLKGSWREGVRRRAIHKGLVATTVTVHDVSILQGEGGAGGDEAGDVGNRAAGESERPSLLRTDPSPPLLKEGSRVFTVQLSNPPKCCQKHTHLGLSSYYECQQLSTLISTCMESGDDGEGHFFP